MSKLRIAWLFTSKGRDDFIGLLRESISKHGNEFEAVEPGMDSDVFFFDDLAGIDLFLSVNPGKLCVFLFSDSERTDDNANLLYYMEVEMVKRLPAMRLSVETYLHSILVSRKESV